ARSARHGCARTRRDRRTAVDLAARSTAAGAVTESAAMTAFSSAGLDVADRVLRDGIATGLFPGLVAAVGHGDVVQRDWVLGAAEDWSGGHRPMSADTVFDVASLTRVLATLPAVLLLIQGGDLSLDTRVADHVPGVDGQILVRHLLTHTSGLPAHR